MFEDVRRKRLSMLHCLQRDRRQSVRHPEKVLSGEGIPLTVAFTRVVLGCVLDERI